MRINFRCELCLLLSITFAGSKWVFCQDVPATAAIRILETARDLAAEGRLKDALRIVQFVQSTPGLTDRESAECKVLLVRFESLAIKFYANRSPDLDRVLSDEVDTVATLRTGARRVANQDEPSSGLAEEKILEAVHTKSDRVEAALAEGGRPQSKTFEWIPVDQIESRPVVESSGLPQSSASAPPIRPAGTEPPRLLTTNTDDQLDSSRPDSVNPPQSPSLLNLIRLTESQDFAGVVQEANRVDSPISLASIPFSTFETACFDKQSASPAMNSRADEPASAAFGELIFDLRWGGLISGLLIGLLLPATMKRFASGMRDSGVRSKRVCVRGDNALLDDESHSIASCDGIFSQIIEENQRLKR